MKEIPPLSCRISVKGKKKTLKIEARVSFHSEAGGAGLLGDCREKSSTIVKVGDYHRANQPLSQGIVVFLNRMH